MDGELSDVAQQPNNLINFISAQEEINKVTRDFMERQSRKQDEAMALIQKLLEKKEDPPSNKRRKVDSEATLGSSSTNAETEVTLSSDSAVPLGNEDILASNVPSSLEDVVTIHSEDTSLLEADDEESELLKNLESRASGVLQDGSAEGTVMSK